MKKSTSFYLLVALILASTALSACAGALDAQGLNFNDLTGSRTLSTESVHSTEPPEIHTTGTPEVKDQGTGEPTEVPETQVVETDFPETEQPQASKTSEANRTPGSDNSHEVLGTVTTIDANGITINNITYRLTDISVIHGTIVAGDFVRLTFHFDPNNKPVVNEVKMTDANGSGDGQGNNNVNSHEGGIHENGTSEPKPGDSGGSGGGSGDGGGG